MNYLSKLFLAICMSVCTISLHAQNAISATGGNASGASGTVSFTIGQVVYTTDNLTLKIGDYEIRNMSYWLIGINGNLIETKEILDAETQISMEHQVAGTYFLKVNSGKRELITFKIIKN